MNLNKSYDFFQPETCAERLHIIGCGAIGSTVAENLVRLGLTNISLYDFDTVEAHNIANQMYRQKDIGQLKVNALRDMLIEINPAVAHSIKTFDMGYENQRLSGYVFLCLDNIDTRREITQKCEGNQYIKAVFDFRMRLSDAQHYAADWSDYSMRQNLLNTMNFTHEEALAETPLSACNLPLSVAPTVRMICAAGVSNFINFVKGNGLRKLILIDAFSYSIDAF
jgi:molybdopterin/thiamine biosynthesis adenylyltransferase